MIRFSLAAAAVFLIVSMYTTASGAKRPKGVGVVVDVFWPSQPNHLRYNIGNGDIVKGRYGYYKPPRHYNLPITDSDNNVLIISKPISKASIYIMFDGINIDPELLKEKIGSIEGEIMDVGTHEWAIQPGDQVHITTEEFHGATKVNLAFMRCGHRDPISDVSFVNHLVHSLTDPENPAAPYIPYNSQIE